MSYTSLIDIKPRAFMFDGRAALTGLVGVQMSIERLADGKFYNGAAFQPAYTTVPCTEKTGNIALEGVYEAAFTIFDETPQSDYDTYVRHAVTPGYTIHQRGEIVTARPRWIAGVDSEKLRVFLFNGTQLLTGRTVNVSIERVRDGFYWNGATFQAAYTDLSMTELTGNQHYEALYQYEFFFPAQSEVIEIYDVSIKFEELGWMVYDKSRIVVSQAT